MQKVNAAMHIVESIRQILPGKVAKVITEAKAAEKEARSFAKLAISTLNKRDQSDDGMKLEAQLH